MYARSVSINSIPISTSRKLPNMPTISWMSSSANGDEWKSRTRIHSRIERREHDDDRHHDEQDGRDDALELSTYSSCRERRLCCTPPGVATLVPPKLRRAAYALRRRRAMPRARARADHQTFSIFARGGRDCRSRPGCARAAVPLRCAAGVRAGPARVDRRRPHYYRLKRPWPDGRTELASSGMLTPSVCVGAPG